MKKHLVTLAILMTLALSQNSCSKPSTKTPEEKDSDSYVVFWFDEQTSKAFIRDSITEIAMAIDGTVLNTRPTKNFWPKAPSCSDLNAVTFHHYLPKSQPLTQSYQVRKFDGKALINGNFTFIAESCATYKIEWK